MSILQTILHSVEGGGRAASFFRLLPLAVMLLIIAVIYNMSVYCGLNDAQSMDNAQLARQLAQGQGFHTKFIRPAVLGQLSARPAAPGTTVELFPHDRFPGDTQRTVPDTYNAPGYPCLLAAWFRLVRPNFGQDAGALANARMYAGDRPIPWLNQIFLLLTAALVYVLGRQLFDRRAAWVALFGFLVTDLLWQYSITALSTSFLMFLVTAAISIAVKIFSIGEATSEEDYSPFWPAWLWTALLGVVLGAACLTRLPLLVLLVPLGVFLFFVPRANVLVILLVVVIVGTLVAPWFWHWNNVSGSPVGSNARLLQLSPDEFPGNQVYRTLEAPSDTRFMKDLSKKEWAGFLWHFQHAWQLLGTNPLVLLFGASLLHTFKRGRARALRWLIVGAAVCLVAANNLCMDAPRPLDEWNILILLLPAMLVVGSAFFLILLDRLDLEHPILNKAVMILVLTLAAFPLIFALLRVGGYGVYNYPPYLPPYLKYMNQFVRPNEWITTDMPWATAWYADRASLWLPDTVVDFNKIYDEYCESSLLLLSPVLLGRPATNLTTGEDKDWLPFVAGTAVPADFPLSGHAAPTKGGPEYIIWGRPH